MTGNLFSQVRRTAGTNNVGFQKGRGDLPNRAPGPCSLRDLSRRGISGVFDCTTDSRLQSFCRGLSDHIRSERGRNGRVHAFRCVDLGRQPSPSFFCSFQFEKDRLNGQIRNGLYLTIPQVRCAARIGIPAAYSRRRLSADPTHRRQAPARRTPPVS